MSAAGKYAAKRMSERSEIGLAHFTASEDYLLLTQPGSFATLWRSKVSKRLTTFQSSAAN